MPYVIPQPMRQETTIYTVHKDLFSAEECENIIALEKLYEPQKALVGDVTNLGIEDPTKRISTVTWLHWDQQTNWIFERLVPNIFQTNNKWWGFHLSGLNEALQLTKYEAEHRGHYDWHEDHSPQGTFSHP